MSGVEAVVDQLADELEEAVRRVAVVVDPSAAVAWPQAARARAGALALGLLSGDRREAAGTAAAIMVALWPNADPDQVGRARWWSTPLGRAVASTVASDRTLTYAQAAAILGVQRATVQVYLRRGYLTRSQEGITLESVLGYLAARNKTAGTVDAR